ncbi:UDP-3-O-(3-hydroxymyristoyl)glucosamine N-acyltransferase [Legionella waltersii]|uniref:UDP-3-O-(3-hydroxymyristoyl) glucosamine N-acyltransferase n=1 Tax=Legionella waltersii TaxID=66969 RepID=A0A0W1A2L8_9GAMM|nr:UDP-3-O-(3-hydroxymyristoyl)glucosamine N-acyltransferase [Legionella waltersii]KTD75597.1 UDP-3-O-(3-hydroxymyristoyl) glucosamine N-acyltransferase [Legionella waltersii]SNU98942.1 UDP-3-O-(3-hydroxymyristoyl) glucosamine N-acyltransferase [Legionella waltersii]
MLTLAELANKLNGVWHGNANYAIFNLSSLQCATNKDLACFDNPRLKELLTTTKAGAVLLKSEHLEWCPVNAIVVEHPERAINQAGKILFQSHCHTASIHPTAQIHTTAKLGNGVHIGANVFIGQNVNLGAGVRVGVNSIIEEGVAIANGTEIGCSVVIHTGSRIEEQVFIGSGCVIGAHPFNYEKAHGSWVVGLVVGGVVISKRTRIGSNSVIDRGSFSDTYIGEGVCIDNLVLIAHDVYIGNNTIIAGCAVVGARTQIGNDCIIGGASCIAANTQLGNDVVISGMSTVTKSITKPGVYSSGTIVHEHESWRRNAARFKRLDDYILLLKAIEKEMNDR